MTSPDLTSSSILLVDDTAENLRLLSEMLLTRGFDARPVTSGREALQAVALDPPDLILLDITMPEMNGFEVCERLQAHHEWREIPVIFLTALSDVADKVKGFSVGGVDYITKPFQLEEVMARVSSQLALRQARRELQATIGKLREAEKLRDDLTHMIVHDLRSPLTGLIAELSIMEMDATGEMAESVRGAAQSAQWLNDIANTLLDVTRMEAGKMPLKRAPTDLVKVAEDVRQSLARMEEGRTITVTSAGAVMANCDAALIRRVLENLVSNAIKHTPRGARVSIDVRPVNDRVRIAVQDEGDGVPPEARERIFQKFGAAEVRKDQSYHSVGLGLAFCRLAVEAHGGRIGVEAASPRGSVFAFELPA